MNVALQLMKIPFAKFVVMFITLSGTMVISCLVIWSTLCRGEGGMFYLGLGYSKICQKRSTVSLILQPIVHVVPSSLAGLHCIYESVITKPYQLKSESLR